MIKPSCRLAQKEIAREIHEKDEKKLLIVDRKLLIEIKGNGN